MRKSFNKTELWKMSKLTIPDCFIKNLQTHLPYVDLNCEENEKYPKEVWDLTGKQNVPTIIIQIYENAL